MITRKKILRIGPSENNNKLFSLGKSFKNPKFFPRPIGNWPDKFNVKLLENNLVEIKRTDRDSGWGGFLVIDMEFDLEFPSKEFIENWITYTGGVCPVFENSFGGDPNANAPLKLKIQQRPSELAEAISFFLNAAKNDEKINFYAEIGACSGGTTRAMYEFLLFEEMLIIDDGGAEIEHMYVNDREDQLRGVNLGFIPRIEIIGNSAEKRVIDQSINISKTHLYDILFIDGDHSYDGVKNDTINYLPIVRQGGYVMFHDSQHIDGVIKWMKEIGSSGLPLKKVKSIAYKDDFTELLTNGLGIEIFQKL